jgi:hypothetical protein
MVGSALSVLAALRLLSRDIAEGQPVLEARLLDAGGEVEEVTLEALGRLDRLGLPFQVGFSQIATERGDYWLLLLSEVVGRVQAADTPEALEEAAWSVDTLLLAAERTVRRHR